MSGDLYSTDTREGLDAARGHVWRTVFFDPLTSSLVKAVSWLKFLSIRKQLAVYEKFQDADLNGVAGVRGFLKSAAANAALYQRVDDLKRFLDIVDRFWEHEHAAEILAEHPALLRAALNFHPKLSKRIEENFQFFEPYLRRPQVYAVLKRLVKDEQYVPFQGADLPSRNTFMLAPYNVVLSSVFSGGVVGGLIGMLVAGPVGAAIGCSIGTTAVVIFGGVYREVSRRFYEGLISEHPHYKTRDPIAERRWYRGSQQDNPIAARAAFGASSGALLCGLIGAAFPIPFIGPVLGALIGASFFAVAAMFSPTIVSLIVRNSVTPLTPAIVPDPDDQPWYQRQLITTVGFTLWGAAIACVVNVFLGGPIGFSLLLVGAAIGAIAGTVTSWMSPALSRLFQQFLHPQKPKLSAANQQSFMLRLTAGSIAGVLIGAALGFFVPGVGVLFGAVVGMASCALLSSLSPIVPLLSGKLFTGEQVMAAVVFFVGLVVLMMTVGQAVHAFAFSLGAIAVCGVALCAMAIAAGPLFRGETLDNPVFSRLAVSSVSGVAIGLAIGVIASLLGPAGAIVLASLKLPAAIGVIAGTGLGAIVKDALPAPATPTPRAWDSSPLITKTKSSGFDDVTKWMSEASGKAPVVLATPTHAPSRSLPPSISFSVVPPRAPSGTGQVAGMGGNKSGGPPR